VAGALNLNGGLVSRQRRHAPQPRPGRFIVAQNVIPVSRITGGAPTADHHRHGHARGDQVEQHAELGLRQRQHGMVGRDHLAGRGKRIVAVGHLICCRDRKIVDPRRAGEVAEIDDPGNAGKGFGVDDDVVRVEVVMDGLVRQLR